MEEVGVRFSLGPNTMDIFVQIFGWVGTLLIVGAYFLISYKKVSGDSAVYQMTNLFGALGDGTNVLYQHAWPAAALQIIQ